MNLLRLRPDRADDHRPAADIFLRIMELAGIQEVFVPKVGLADGIVYDLYMRRKGPADLRGTRPWGERSSFTQRRHSPSSGRRTR